MIRGGRCRRLLAAGTALVVLLACSGDDGGDGADDGGGTTTVTALVLDPEAVEAYLGEVREGEGDALANRDDEALLVDGQVFCSTLAATGSALEAANALQAASGTYDGQTRVIEVARRTLCPEQEGS